LNRFNNSVTLANTGLRLPENDADALKHVRVLKIYKMLFIYLYIVCICSIFFGLGNKSYSVGLATNF